MKNTIDHFYTGFKKTFASISDKNWNSKLSSYLKDIKSFSGNTDEERMIAGWVAALCERAYYVSAHKKNMNVRADFANRLKDITNSALLPKFLTYSGSVICGKQQPSLVETIAPTLDRFKIMELLPEVFGNGIDSIIVGGSMSYIPFFGIRENLKINDFSDIDTLIVINDDFFNKSSWSNFIKSDLFPESDKKIFLDRIKIFQKLYSKKQVDVFSQRFSIIGKPFTISSHFLTSSVFKRMVDTDLKRALRIKKDMQYVMHDFRVDPFRHPCHARHTFNGDRFESTIDGHTTEFGGFISDMPGFIISNGKFYPGVYQTVISPGLLTFHDDTGETKKLVKKFEKTLYNEVGRERKQFPIATYARAHNRFDIFPPGRYDNGHDSYVSPKIIRKFELPLTPNIIRIGSTIRLGKFIINKIQNTENNTHAREKSTKLLDKWKKEVLNKAEKEIKNFIHQHDKFESEMTSAKKNGDSWYTVITIPSSKKVSIKLPDPYRRNNSIVYQEILTRKITPGDIMRINLYAELAQRSKKVYVATINDPRNKNNIPTSYNLVIPVL